MLPSLDRLALVTTGGNLGNAQWPEDEVCSICTYPLARPSEDQRYAWPFPDEGGGFTAVACFRGHAFHKGCLRFMQRFHDTNCPDCRTPMFNEVLKDVSRPTQEELDELQQRQAQQAEQRAREREQRERVLRAERARVEALPVAQARWAEEPSDPLMRDMMLNEAERGHFSSVVDRNMARTFIRFRFWLKGTMTEEEVWNVTFELKRNFGRWMGATSALPPLPRDSWENRLGARIVPERLSSIVGAGDPNSYEDRNARQEVLRCEFVLQLDDRTAAVFLAQVQERIARGSDWPTLAGEWFQFASIRATTLGDAPRVNQHAPLGRVPQPEMTPTDFATWSPWRRFPAAAPARQANWMLEEAMAEMRADDPIANFRPVGWAATDVTIRWRFWLKGPMTGVERSNTPMHWRRAFADAMRDAPGLPEMRTSQDPWFERLWVWTRAEEPRITGPRSGQPLVNGDIVQRCEFALKLPADVAWPWLMLVARGFGGVSHWHNLVPIWFYVEHAWSTESRDRPQLDSSTLHPLVGAPMLTEAQFNAWEPWGNIQRFRSLDANGQ